MRRLLALRRRFLVSGLPLGSDWWPSSSGTGLLNAPRLNKRCLARILGDACMVASESVKASSGSFASRRRYTAGIVIRRLGFSRRWPGGPGSVTSPANGSGDRCRAGVGSPAAFSGVRVIGR